MTEGPYTLEKKPIQKILHDEYGNRIVKCKYCNCWWRTDDCVMYGGKDTVNEGICKKCAKERGWSK